MKDISNISKEISSIVLPYSHDYITDKIKIFKEGTILKCGYDKYGEQIFPIIFATRHKIYPLDIVLLVKIYKNSRIIEIQANIGRLIGNIEEKEAFNLFKNEMVDKYKLVIEKGEVILKDTIFSKDGEVDLQTFEEKINYLYNLKEETLNKLSTYLH